MRTSFLVKMFGRHIGGAVWSHPELDTETGGISSMTADMLHVLFLDYDGVDRHLVERDYRQLAEMFDLGPAYLFVTDRERNGWHLINLERHTFHTTQLIMSRSHADQAYLDSFKRNPWRSWILRTEPKGGRPRPSYVGVIYGKYRGHDYPGMISLAHARFLRDHYQVPAEDIRWTPNDGLGELAVESYATREVTTP